MKISKRATYPFALLATVVLLAAACGGAGPASSPSLGATQASSGATVDPCFPVSGRCPGEAQSLTASGATFPAVIYTKWVDEYNARTGVQVNYQPIGSGGGIKAILERTVDFAGSDAPMTDQQLADAKAPILHIPTVMGAVVATYNVAGVTKLQLTPDTLSGIYLGTIKTWNDPRISADNPGVGLPGSAIVPIFRSDGSGTTFAFTDYLSKVSPDFKSKVGTGTSVNWPGGVGAKGNDGVAGAVKTTPSSIGYVELIYAIQQKLPAATLRNAAGKFVEPTLDAVTKAAQGISYPADLRVSVTNAPDPAAWPIATFTFYLTYASIADRAKALATVRYFWWSAHEGQAFAKDLGYAALPKEAQQKAEEKIRSITSGGQPVIPAAR
jgi:phosphate transport system substrate-binding protein